MKPYTEEMKALLESGEGFSFCHCFNFALQSSPTTLTTLRITDAPFNVTLSNVITFVSTNLINELDTTTQDQELTINEYNLTFTNVDQTILALFTANEQRGKLCAVRRFLLNKNGTPITEPLLVNRFVISSYSTNGETLIVTLKSHAATLLQPAGITTSMESFRRFYPETTSCINTSNIKERFKWAYD
jgi:hypothetical protein